MTNEDLPLKTLMTVKNDVAPELDRELLKQCYETQKRHQFDSDRNAVVQTMERLIEAEVARLAGNDSSGGDTQ
ncbi:MAG: hypothetical protein KIT15_05135 [Xanthobacteraceae bacterium]|nr:hypothetical protein [Xanthobacteraceae bacterium]MCW5678244.1 hypothetical protein [Xanthobacteraceae bacterium]